MRKYFQNCLVGFIVSSITGTSIAQINGTITDNKSGKPINGVEVFINNTIARTQSDDAGQFTLANVLTGFHELILYKKGYALYQSSMRIQAGHAYNLKLSLIVSKKKKTTPLTQEETALLKNKLSSETGSLSSVVISNEKELAVSMAEGKRMLTAGSPLTIQNNTTGYRIKYYVTEIPLQDISRAPVSYEPLPALEVKQNVQWEKNRKNYFQGSQRHWLVSLVAMQIEEQGYTLQNEKGNNVDAHALLSPSSLPGYSKLTISQPLVVHHKKEDGSIKTSRVLTDGPVDVYGAGLLINSKALIIEGAMANVGLADRVPIDYQPIAGDVENVYAQTLERFYEKIYVQTDKPYYYPGEPLWFKGYVHYKEPAWRDSLSRVMYVELIDPNRKIAINKTVKIDSGLFHNDFILPDTLTAGTYFLRAYTNLARNFGDSNLFVKPILILRSTDKVDHAQGKLDEIKGNLITVISDKKKYKVREKVSLTLRVKDKEGKPLTANLSMAVTDATQVVPIAEPITILNDYPFSGEKQRRTIELNYPVEYGVSFKGKFLNDNGNPEKTMLTIFQMKPRNMIMAASDQQGIFSMTGLHFYDTAMFSFKADKAKNHPYGKVELLQREIPPMHFREDKVPLITQSTQTPQRILSDYEVPKDNKLLKTVEVRASRIPEEFQKDYRVKRPYGTPDYVLKAKDINTSYGNLMYAIQGRFPGLVMRRNDSGGWVVYTQRGALSSISNNGEVLVTVNDIQMTSGDGTGRTPDQVISSINPQTVESIEFTNRINVLYGSSGMFGVLAIYTKQGISEDAKITPNFQTVKLTGYGSSRNFKFPDYDDKETDTARADYRSTIYWNPNINTNPGTGTSTVSFFAADSPGPYRIVVEGITQTGAPVRCVYFLEIESR